MQPVFSFGPSRFNPSYHQLLRNENNASFKGSFLIQNMILITRAIRENDTQRWRMLKQTLFSAYGGLKIHKHHQLFSSFNEKIIQLTSSGLFNYWLEKWTKHRKIIEEPPPPPPVILSMDHLDVGFQIWALVLAMASLAFIGELLTFWSPKILQLLFFKYVLRRYFKRKHN